jgi:hypothetical protein
MTYAEDIETFIEGQTVRFVVIGDMGWSGYREDSKPEVKKNVVQTWAEARESLNYDYDTGFGAPDCHAIAAYTENYVIMCYQYDGATGLFSVPRNPTAETPEMPGGG